MTRIVRNLLVGRRISGKKMLIRIDENGTPRKIIYECFGTLLSGF